MSSHRFLGGTLQYSVIAELSITLLLRPEVMELWITEGSPWSIREEKCFNLTKSEMGGITLIPFHWELVEISFNISTGGASQEFMLS